MKDFSLIKIIGYLKRYMCQLSTQGVYAAFLLYNAWSSKSTPSWAKNIIVGALAYFLSPIDGIPDLTPFIGMTDDIGLMSFSLVTIACYIDNEVRAKAYRQLLILMNNKVDIEAVQEVDSWLLE